MLNASTKIVDEDLNYCYNSFFWCNCSTLLGLINQVVVEPFIDKAIAIQTQRAIDAGENIDPLQQLHYRVWQKAGEVVAKYGILYGISLSALYGIVFVYSRNSSAWF